MQISAGLQWWKKKNWFWQFLSIEKNGEKTHVSLGESLVMRTYCSDILNDVGDFTMLAQQYTDSGDLWA